MPFGKKTFPRTVYADAPDDATRSNAEVIADFDAVWEKLIRPALVAAGCRHFRADEEARAGEIRTDMFFELVTQLSARRIGAQMATLEVVQAN